METSPKQHGYNLFKYVTKEKKDVTNIYFYAILNGLVQLSVPLGIQSIVSFVMGATMATSIYILIAFVVLGTWLVGYFRLKVMQIIEKIQQKIFVEFSLAFAEKLPKVNLSATRKYYLPELVNRFFDTQNLQKGISKILLEIPTALIQILFGILLLSFYHPWFLVFGALVVICVIIIFRFTMESGIKSSIEESDKKYEVASWIEDIAASIKTFKLNSKTEAHLSGTDERVVKYLDDRTSHFRVLVFQYKTIIAFKVIITLVMLVIGTYLLVNQQLNIGAFIATEIVVLSIMAAVEKLIISLESYYDVIAALAKLNKVTTLQEEKFGEITFDQNNDGFEVEFKDVNFAFNDHHRILENINFKIPENSLTIISGQLGAGKSLLLNMMTGFYDPTSGSILFDKIPLKNIDKISLRSQIGMYLEDMTIIKGTVYENIILGQNETSAEQILEIAEEIGIEDFSSQFSNGFFTNISETDTEISFSSKKKILLLRALVGERRLLILEDPLDGMNDEFKAKMMEYLLKLKEKTTIIIVSEDKNLILEADQHLQVEDGNVKKLFNKN
ncbi:MULTISPECIES: peptidase domain-containing ABC transporter [unclassified Chryseobacterium]|jgi:ABC-type bacteriocin/lantibiotic exporter with double-glycine peptidase domain|uniref:peptidase domain-containing ABC transporter n=1 Tax=unclassified Chryseobacterium TaxID=2593645 RepID=UPI000D3A91DE|nr:MULTISPECIES: ATP-binding cassette domain-containing protein [unclassified Chryseobacterium]PTT77571.1 ABC transporter ATP-binding protein [Chryseobacterium sp. HMWF001]PVV54977.1 ABC transporter ATP-binding protein [Chryseobacterium sp. HMWF035]